MVQFGKSHILAKKYHFMTRHNSFFGKDEYDRRRTRVTSYQI